MAVRFRSSFCSYVKVRNAVTINNLASPTRLPLLSQCIAWSQRSMHSSHSIPVDPAASASSKRRGVVANGPLAKAPLARFPFSCLLRSFLLTTLTTSPVLLLPSLRLLSAIAYSTNPLLSPSSNPIIRWVLKQTVYRHFCAGENPAEIKQTVDFQRKVGIQGILLAWAKEVEHRGEGYGTAQPGEASDEDKQEIRKWTQGTLATVSMAPEGDFVCLKFTGCGSLALLHLTNDLPPPPYLQTSIDSICALAKSRNIRLVIDAEQAAVQRGIDNWILSLQRRYNRVSEPDLSNQKSEPHAPRALIYGTYQAYLHSTPSTLARDLGHAATEGFVLGIKLVRGAYLGSDPRTLMWDTKEETDAAYDSIAESLLRRRYEPLLALQNRSQRNGASIPASSSFPNVNLVLAGHNISSVRKVMAIQEQQVRNGEQRIEMVYAQLLGMADHVSGELVQAATLSKEAASAEMPRACKYMVWGSVGDCMKYLVRRAEENRDAVRRTDEAKVELKKELWRRIMGRNSNRRHLLS